MEGGDHDRGRGYDRGRAQRAGGDHDRGRGYDRGRAQMAGGDHDGGRGYDRGRGQKRGRGHHSGRGYGDSPDNRSSSHDRGSGSRQSSGNSSSSSESSSHRYKKRLEAEYRDRSSDVELSDIPILQTKSKQKPKQGPIQDVEHDDPLRRPAQENASARSSATPIIPAHRVGDVSRERQADSFNANFPSLLETQKRSRVPDIEYADLFRRPAQENQSARSSATPIVPAHRVGDVSRERQADSSDAKFSSLLETQKRSRGSEPPFAGDIHALPTEVAESTQSPPPPADEETVLKQKFGKLLNNCYKAMGEQNAKSKQHTLKVNFDELLKEDYIDLAIKIKEKASVDPGHLWLQPVVSDFLNTWFGYDTRQDKRMLRFRFLREPKSIHPLSHFTKEIVVQKQPIFDGQYEIVRTTKTGRLLYLSVLTHVLTLHKNRESYQGNFEEKQIYILEYKGKGRLRCTILATRICLYEDDFNARILDLKGVNLVLTPRYELSGEVPAFFPNLKSDLGGLTRRILEESGILSVLPFHYALMSPGAWGFFIWKLHLVIQRLKLSGSDFSVLFGKRVKGLLRDWRPAFKNSEDQVVKGVYHHDNNGPDKFTNDLGGMCDCDRHMVQHAHHHPKGNPVKVRREDENELFAAMKMPDVVPAVIGGLFVGKEMQFKEELGEVFEDFCKFAYDPDEDVFEDFED